MALGLEEKLTYLFKDKSLLEVALTHKSFANEGKKKGTKKEEFVRKHNERLEFLGDAVLGLVVTDLLSERFPGANEGDLSKMRSSMVKEATLAVISRELDLGAHLLLGKGESSNHGRDKDSILASTYESVLGAIYLDGGLSAAYTAVCTHFAKFLEEVSQHSLQHDTKTQLQELCQARYRKSPSYKVVGEEGPDHEKTFEIMVSVAELKRYGKGRNKKEAETVAARFLLDYLTNPQGSHESNI